MKQEEWEPWFEFARRLAQALMGLVAIGVFVSYPIRSMEIPGNVLGGVLAMLGIVTVATVKGRPPDDSGKNNRRRGVELDEGDRPEVGGSRDRAVHDGRDLRLRHP